MGLTRGGSERADSRRTSGVPQDPPQGAKLGKQGGRSSVPEAAVSHPRRFITGVPDPVARTLEEPVRPLGGTKRPGLIQPTGPEEAGH